jgi:hypothetical protein
VTEPLRRPSPLRWIAYAYGAGLPEQNSTWVLHDVTCKTFAFRHLARLLMQVGPFVVLILVLVPGAFWIRGASVVGAVIMAAIFSFAYLVETSEHRLVKAGYPVGTGEKLRSERSRTDRSEAVARRRAKMDARYEKRARR